MNFKNTLFFILMVFSCYTSMAQNPCGCPDDGELVCAQLEEDGEIYYLPLPNECIAQCLGFTLVADSLCFTPIWSECDCVIDENEPEICVQFDGYTFQVPNECIANCKDFTIVADSLCNRNPIFNCECPFDNSLPWICAQDSLGHIYEVPNSCFAACWGMIVVSDDLCGGSDIIDFGTIECFDDLDIEADMLFQEILLAFNQSCYIDLPECVIDAPLFASDSLFMDYIFNNCDLFGTGDDDGGEMVAAFYNFYRSISSSTNDSFKVLNTSIQLGENPVSNNLVYYVESKIATRAQITLFDMNGKIIFSNNLQLSEGKQKYETDISQLKSGLFMLNLRTEESQQSLKVIVIN